MSNTEVVKIVDSVNFPELIRAVESEAYMNGLKDEPFYICDLGDIIQKHKLWLSKLPRVEPFYALKSNPNPMVVRILSQCSIGFDCASRSEMAQVLEAGVPPERIIYANPCKHSSYLSYAAEHDVRMLTFDSISELQKISAYHPNAELILRIFVGADKARCPLGLKFGAFIDEVPNLIEAVISLNLNLIGVSFHVGSGCFDAQAYSDAIRLSKVVFTIAKERNLTLTLLDLGGGFPGNFDTSERLSFFDNVCDTINETLDDLFPVSSGVRIIAEPGRYYISSAFQLSCSVTSIRPLNQGSGESSGFSYFLNDGLYGSFNCIYFDHYIGEHYLLDDVFVDPLDSELHASVFWGPTCDSMDKILDNFSIRKLKIGDCVVFKNMGAYTMAAGSTFNGFNQPYIRYFSSYANWQILAPLLQPEDFSNSMDEVANMLNSSFPIDSANGFIGKSALVKIRLASFS